MGVPKDTCIRYCICREDRCFVGTEFTILSGLYGEPRRVGGWMGTYLAEMQRIHISCIQQIEASITENLSNSHAVYCGS